MSAEKRMAGDYEIIQSIFVDGREIVLGENPNDEKDQFYMVGFCDTNELFTTYYDCLVSESYPEILEIFGQRIADGAHRIREIVREETETVGDNTPFSAARCREMDGCQLVSYDDDLHNKLVIIKPEVLTPEYRLATHQLKLCTGGFGASPHSRGSACFCVDLYSGKSSRFERGDILGTLEPELLPKWAALGLEQYQNQLRQKAAKRREER